MSQTAKAKGGVEGGSGKATAPKINSPEAFQLKLESVLDNLESGAIDPSVAPYILQNLKLQLKVSETLAKYGLPSGIIPIKARAA